MCSFSLEVSFNFKVKEVPDDKSDLLVILLVNWGHYDYDHIESLTNKRSDLLVILLAYLLIWVAASLSKSVSREDFLVVHSPKRG